MTAASRSLANLQQDLEQPQARVAVIGLGYVGLPLLARLGAAGFPVLGIDSDQDKIAQLQQGHSYLSTVAATTIHSLLQHGVELSTDLAMVATCAVVVICVPTPLGEHRDPNLHFVRATLDGLVPHLSPGSLLILESTTYPGTTEEEILPRLARRGWQAGREVAVVYAPEREDPGSTFPAANIPKVLGGVTATCTRLGAAFYRHVVNGVVQVSSPRVAEMSKLLENIHRAVNIGLVNEMKMVADAMDIDIVEVIQAAASKPFGFTPYYPGPGLGGHCIPIDPFYLTWKAKEYGVHTRFIELAGEINHAMPNFVVGKLRDALNARGQALKGSRVLIIGLAYKKNVDDTRESPALAIMHQLQNQGVELSYHDPLVARIEGTRRYAIHMHSQELDPACLGSQDAVLLVTDHDQLDYEFIAQHAALIIDTRGRYPAGTPGVVRA